MKNRFATLILLATTLGACGAESGELVVLKRREPRTLLHEGTALTAEEAARRRAEDEETARAVKSQQDLFKAQNRLKGAKTAIDRAEALARLGALGDAAAAALPAVEALLADADADVRLAALEARIAIRGEGAEALLLRALKDDEPRVRRAVVELWAGRRPDDPGPLLAALEDEDAGVQYAALSGLGAAENLAPELLARIAEGLEDMGGPAAKAAFDLLFRNRDRLAGFESAVATLLDHRDQTARLLVADRCRAAGIFSKGLAEKIVQCVVEDPEPSVRGACYRWLEERGSPPPPVFDVNADDRARWQARGPLLAWREALPD